MFTGLIRHRGKLQRLDRHLIRIDCVDLTGQVRAGDSVAVNGVCLTAVRTTACSFEADLLEETLARTTLGSLANESFLNLEPALRVGDQLGGHQLLGHVDGTAAVLNINERAELGREVTVENPGWLNPYLIDQGSIAVDGVSLTVQSVCKESFTVALIPATLAATNLGDVVVRGRVNIEIDYLVKAVRQTVEHLLPAMLADRGQGWSQAASNSASEER